jgi:23S rRNA (guanosine2251-2'-O)-methyltransferase
MLIRCPYPDCLFIYEQTTPEVAWRSLSVALCPQCKKKGTAISLEIHNLFQERARQTQESQFAGANVAKESMFQVLIENMRSLWNVGSIFRTADAAGVSILYLCGITGCPPKNQISKTALGAEQVIPWQYFAHPLEIIPKLKAQGVIVAGLERNQRAINLSSLLKEKKISKPLCLVIGNENQGLSPETSDYCNYICSLPMRGIKESLNAAVAFGIAAYLINEYIPNNDITGGVENDFRL